jgi:hypothetical protein
MKYSVEIASGGMIYLPRSTKIGSGDQKLFGGGDTHTDRHTHTHTHTEQGDLISLLSFLKIRKVS